VSLTSTIKHKPTWNYRSGWPKKDLELLGVTWEEALDLTGDR